MSITDDPRTFPGCAVNRWLEVCDLADGLGRALARRALTAAIPPSATSAHTHLPSHQRWRERRWLVTGVDQHGRLGEDAPLSARAVTICLAIARTRASEAAGACGHRGGQRGSGRNPARPGPSSQVTDQIPGAEPRAAKAARSRSASAIAWWIPWLRASTVTSPWWRSSPRASPRAAKVASVYCPCWW